MELVERTEAGETRIIHFWSPDYLRAAPFRKGLHQAVIDDLSRVFLHFS
jgi:hypothetical protein